MTVNATYLVRMAEIIVQIVWGYLFIGLGVAAVFLSFGLGRVDEEARGAYLFRILLIPGVIGLWPLVGWRWFQISRRQKS